MLVFGRKQTRIDSKNRIQIPIDIVETIPRKQSIERFYGLIDPDRKWIWLFTPKYVRRWFARFDPVDYLKNPAVRDFAMWVGANLYSISVDRYWRMVLPKEFVEKIKPENSVGLLASGKFIAIMPVEELEKVRQELNKRKDEIIKAVFPSEEGPMSLPQKEESG